MQLYLHIDISKKPKIFSADKIPPVKEWVPQAMIFDLDNHSDSLTISTAVRAMHAADKIFLYIEAEPDAQAGSILKIMSQIMKISSPIGIYYTGEHNVLSKILFRFKNKCIEPGNLQNAVKSFFNSPA